MNKYPDFWSVILGNGPHGFFFGYWVMWMIASVAMAIILVAGRDRKSSNTPSDWSWRFFWVNNVLRFVSTILLGFLFVRLVYEYVAPAWMLLISIGLGFGYYKLAHVARKWGILTTNNLSERIKQAIEAQKQLESNAKNN